MNARDVCKMVLKKRWRPIREEPYCVGCGKALYYADQDDGSHMSYCDSPPERCFVVAAKMALEQPDADALVKRACADGWGLQITSDGQFIGIDQLDDDGMTRRYDEGTDLDAILRRLIAAREAK